MRQVFLDKGMAVVKEVAQPVLDDYSVLVAVHYSFISSGTEIATITNSQASLFTNVPHKVKKVLESVSMHGIEGATALIKSKLKGEVAYLGYSCSGHVIAVGKKVKHFRSGDFVACAGAGYAHHADLVCVPEHLVVKINNKELLRDASITTIGTIALQGVRRAQLQLGEWVCVVGLGLLGQLTVQLAKRAGCLVIGTDILDERLSLARTIGADVVLHAAKDDILQEILTLTGNHGVDASIITAASKSNTIAQQAIETTRRKGRVVIVGDINLNFNRDPLYKKEIDLLISCSYGPGRYDVSYEEQGQDYPYAYVRWTENRNMQSFVRMLEQGAIAINPLISQEVSLDEIVQVYEAIQKKELLGVVLSYMPHRTEYKEIQLPKAKNNMSIQETIRFVPAVKDTFRVGIIGAGGFAKVKLMPLIAKMPSATIDAVVDVDVATSIDIAQLYDGAQSFTHEDVLYEKNLVDVVVIASPHKFHAQQALKALQHGKAVFLEKPMVTDYEQLEEMRTFLAQNPHVPLCVDFNRAFSPFLQKIKAALAQRETPLMVQYRMNVNFIPKDHWIQSELGAGRVIGEACHILDLFCFLTDSDPLAVSVEALYASRTDIFPTDNFSVHVSFSDGSVCSLLYTALGHPKLGKERMEIFFDSKAIVMEDYIKMYSFGLSTRLNDAIAAQDKGHEELLNRFFNAISNEIFEPPIPFKRLLKVAELTLLVDRLVCEGGGVKSLS